MWLVQKVLRDTTKIHGFKTFQEFLDNQQYSSKGILRYEKVFGRTFISTGGLETTKVVLVKQVLFCFCFFVILRYEKVFGGTFVSAGRLEKQPR